MMIDSSRPVETGMKSTTLCYIRKGGRILMLYRNKNKGDGNDGKWLGIGGKIEPGESPDECNIREVREETGLELPDAQFLGLIKFRSTDYEDEDMYLYVAENFEPADALPECSEGELRWVSEDEVMSLPMWEGDKYFLGQLLAGRKSVSMTLSYEGETCTVIEE